MVLPFSLPASLVPGIKRRNPIWRRMSAVRMHHICASYLHLRKQSSLYLRLLNVPEALMGQSTAYIRAVLLGLLATMLYNGCASILRAVGDTTAPLLFLLFAAALNVALDLLFILKFGFGVAGAAWATVLSQSLSAIISLVYMFKRYPVFRFKPDDFKLKLREIKALYTSGLSMAAMMSLVFSEPYPFNVPSIPLVRILSLHTQPPARSRNFHASILCYGRYHGNLLRAEYGSRT